MEGFLVPAVYQDMERIEPAWIKAIKQYIYHLLIHLSHFSSLLFPISSPLGARVRILLVPVGVAAVLHPGHAEHGRLGGDVVEGEGGLARGVVGVQRVRLGQRLPARLQLSGAVVLG